MSSYLFCITMVIVLIVGTMGQWGDMPDYSNGGYDSPDFPDYFYPPMSFRFPRWGPPMPPMGYPYYRY
ncbi:hypothetical protein ACF0H5_020911 [Mactra antiquata]